MLYQFYETQRALLSPHRLAKEYEKPAFEITSAEVDGVQVAVQ